MHEYAGGLDGGAEFFGVGSAGGVDFDAVKAEGLEQAELLDEGRIEVDHGEIDGQAQVERLTGSPGLRSPRRRLNERIRRRGSSGTQRSGRARGNSRATDRQGLAPGERSLVFHGGIVGPSPRSMNVGLGGWFALFTPRGSC